MIFASCMFFLILFAGIIDWNKVQELKKGYLELTAKHAIEQQKKSQMPYIPISMDGNAEVYGDIKLVPVQNGSLSLEIKASPRNFGTRATERICINLDRPMNMLSGYSGLAVFVRTGAGTSPEVRTGLIVTGTNGHKAEILPVLPVLSAWGDELHELYFDWGSFNYENAEEAATVMRNVSQVEFTFAGVRRAPERGSSSQPVPAKIQMSDLRLVDYIRGSYDPSRQSLTFDREAGSWIPDNKYDFTLQHRTQEVTGIVATYGKEEGILSAVSSLDMAARTQCWDGSFLDGRRGAVTVASGEYTFGFTIYGLLQGYKHLEKIKHPLLDETMNIGPFTMTRREFYQRMFYRAAMARTAATPSGYRDDIIGGNTLITGANRVLGYAIAMRMVADVLNNPEWKKNLLDKYVPIMQEISDAQGKFSGGFPVLGEGDRYNGRGIHYDAGYTRTHMDFLVVGVVQTGDPFLVGMLKKYQAVFEAAMNEQGTGILPMISERGRGNSAVRLILPDATYQVGVKYKLPVIAQWGYNCSQLSWAENENQRRNHFATASNARGYTLGAHMSILLDDMQDKPVPKDPGYLFPRQFPLWSTSLFSKDGKLLRISSMTFLPDGTQETDYKIEVGEYPSTVGVPVMIRSNGKVKAVAIKLTGWPKLLPDGARIKFSGDIRSKGRVGKAIEIKLEKETQIVVKGPDTVLPAEMGGDKIPFSAEFKLTPEKPGQTVSITILNGTVPYSYKSESDVR